MKDYVDFEIEFEVEYAYYQHFLQMYCHVHF